MKYLLLSLLVLSTTVMSADKKIVAQVASSNSRTATDETLDITPEDKSEKMADKTGLYTNNHSMKAQIICKTHDGKNIKIGEKGYKECIQNVKKDNSDVKVEFVK